MSYLKRREKVFHGKRKSSEAKVPEETGPDRATLFAISSEPLSASSKKMRTEFPPSIGFTSG